jgi:hypothetical protein
MQEWEYKYVVHTGWPARGRVRYEINGQVVEGGEIWELMNELGTQGWELAAFREYDQGTYVFKRPIE